MYDPKLASARVEHLRNRLADAARTKDESAAQAELARRALAKAESNFAVFDDNVKRAREDFDADATKRPASVKARATLEDAKHDVERARRLASDAASLAESHAAAWRAVRADVARAETSEGMIALRTAPIVDRARDAYASLMGVFMDLHGLRAEFLATRASGLREANVSESNTDVPRMPDVSDLRRRAIEALRVDVRAQVPDGASNFDPDVIWQAFGWAERQR